MRGQHRSEEGFTLIEMTLVSALLLVVLAMLLPLITDSLNLLTNTQVRSDTVDNVQLALSQVSHDVVSSNVLYQDSSGIVHLETYGDLGTSNCVEYQVVYPAAAQAQIGTLERRTKLASSATWPSGWASLMTGIVNSSQPNPAPQVFSILPSSQYRSLVVDLWDQVDTRTVAAAAPENYTSTFTGPAIPANVPPPGNPVPSSEPCA